MYQIEYASMFTRLVSSGLARQRAQRRPYSILRSLYIRLIRSILVRERTDSSLSLIYRRIEYRLLRQQLYTRPLLTPIRTLNARRPRSKVFIYKLNLSNIYTKYMQSPLFYKITKNSIGTTLFYKIINISISFAKEPRPLTF